MGRVVAAFFIAPWASVIASWPGQIWTFLIHGDDWQSFDQTFDSAIIYPLFGFVSSLVFGLPLLIWLMKARRLSLGGVVLIGTATGALPILLFGLFNIAYTAIFFPAQLSILPVASFLTAVTTFATVGAACGGCFWIVAFWQNEWATKYTPNK